MIYWKLEMQGLYALSNKDSITKDQFVKHNKGSIWQTSICQTCSACMGCTLTVSLKMRRHILYVFFMYSLNFYPKIGSNRFQIIGLLGYTHWVLGQRVLPKSSSMALPRWSKIYLPFQKAVWKAGCLSPIQSEFTIFGCIRESHCKSVEVLLISNTTATFQAGLRSSYPLPHWWSIK